LAIPILVTVYRY